LALVDVREIDTLNLNGFNTSSCEHLQSPVETGRGSLASLWTATTGDGVAPIDLEEDIHTVGFILSMIFWLTLNDILNASHGGVVFS